MGAGRTVYAQRRGSGQLKHRSGSKQLDYAVPLPKKYIRDYLHLGAYLTDPELGFYQNRPGAIQKARHGQAVKLSTVN